MQKLTDTFERLSGNDILLYLEKHKDNEVAMQSFKLKLKVILNKINNNHST